MLCNCAVLRAARFAAKLCELLQQNPALGRFSIIPIMLRSAARTFRLVVGVLGVFSAPLQAQTATRVRTPLPSQDSVITKLIGTTLIARLAPIIADAGLRDTAIPWVITVPSDSGALRWSVIAAVLRRPLFARDRRPDDRAYHLVSVWSYRYDRDSVTFDFAIGSQRACGTTFKGGGTEYRAAMAWPKYPSYAVRMPSIEIEFNSSGACQTP